MSNHDAVRAALAELVAATNPDGETSVADWRKAWAAARAALSEPAPGVVVPDGYRLVDGTRLLQQIRAACAATLKAGPGVAVPLPTEVSAEFRKFMRGEPNIIEQLPFADVVKMAESPDVSALAAAPSPTAPPSTPNASLPPLGEGTRTKIQITVEVPADWANRLDMQWVLEREIHADRWAWNWPTTAPQGPTP